MGEKQQRYSLTHLLDQVEKAHKAEIQLYTSGHLNHNKLFRPQGLLRRNYWGSAQKPALLLRRPQFMAPSQASQKTKHSFTSDTDTPPPTHARSASYLCWQPRASKAPSVAPANVPVSGAPLTIQRKEVPEEEEEEEGEGLFKRQLIREELDVPEMRILKTKPVKNSRICVLKETSDEYQFFPSYLADVTKTDQYYKFMQFQKDVIGKQDLLENDYVGSKSAERHERKLAQALRNICDCTRPHFYRVQAVGDVFEDICSSSWIFGDILKEVKNEYELYMVILLDALPTMQYRTLQNEVKGMEKRTVMTYEIEEHRHNVQVLVQKAKSALARNEEYFHSVLHSLLECGLHLALKAAGQDQHSCPNNHGFLALAEKKKVESDIAVSPFLSTAELLTSLRHQIIMKWEEIQAMEKEIKDTMTFAGMVNIREKTVKELEGEASKLQGSNKFLKKQIKDVEQTITTTLKRQKFTTDSQRFLWDLVRDFLAPVGKVDPFELDRSLSNLSLLNV
ncbi:hypothetical protein JRQ81_009611 [Phrynocephalus forsythii]|uniref:Translin-associated factor X-interacting protein 1 N-terminal domain-containing protein n=1 Tax=Phrynocephalus forsythii TaxID=171643 RepID=A0A9Q0Y6P1_9SAUR|nr:hypothetical protein JRQ81_009611 [Phrynocephalus forsythii]